ncbi:restriction endonuclease subunit S [Pseudoroseomonas globiformis]|uniref:Restriction endonuclease subunit S n=1 Tax=Teichococcus globiformis TaxID=2307229 RepID=A0ABV7G0Z2_9PROT
MSIYPVCPLGEIVENFDAQRRPVKSSERRPGPYPYYGAQGVVDHVDGFLFDGEFVLVAEDGENLRSRSQPIALLARGRFWVNNHAHILRGTRSLDTRFLFYAINQADIAGYVTGSTIPKLSQGSLNRIQIPCPPIDEQRGIVAILGALDDKIDLNRRMNETLEAMARAIFKDWFVEFGPIRAKMDGRPPYLAPDLWALFPDRLDDEGKPKGWAQGSLHQYATLNAETWTQSAYPESVEYVDLSGTKWGYVQETSVFSRQEAPSRAQRILRAGDTIVGTVRPGNGSFALIGRDGFTGSTGFAALRPKSQFCRELVYLAATAEDNIERLAHLADGGAYPAVRPDVVANTEVWHVNEATLRAFHHLTAPLLDQFLHHHKESRTLAATRDLLLPKLMSGEVRVRDAENLLGAVA